MEAGIDGAGGARSASSRSADQPDRLSPAKERIAADGAAAVEALTRVPLVGRIIKLKVSDFNARCNEASLSVDDAEDVVLAIWRRVRGLFKS